MTNVPPPQSRVTTVVNMMLVMVMMKTHHDRLIDLEKTLVELHPYDVPEMIALEIKEGHTPYLDWVGRA